MEGVPKVVVFFRMACEDKKGPKDVSEVREIEWLAPSDALARLTYDTERRVLVQAYADSESRKAE